MELSDDDLQTEARYLLTFPMNDDLTVLDLRWFQPTDARDGQCSMSSFSPRRDTILNINSINYAFVAGPFLTNDDDVFAMEGGEATVYQLRDSIKKGKFALKVLKPSYRQANGEHIERVAATLAAHKDRPGLILGNRLCITKAAFPRSDCRIPRP